MMGPLAHTNPQAHSRGFSLLEVLIALGILAISLVVFLEGQASSLNNAGRTRDMTVVTLLARSKMVDIEQIVFDEGFVAGKVEEKGDFSDEGRPDVKWRYVIDEIGIDTGGIRGLCDMFAGFAGESEDTVGSSCEAMLGVLSGPIENLTDEVSRSLRAVELTVTWPIGKYEESVVVRALVTQDAFMPASPEAAAVEDALSEQNAQGLPPGGGLQQPNVPPGQGVFQPGGGGLR